MHSETENSDPFRGLAFDEKSMSDQIWRHLFDRNLQIARQGPLWRSLSCEIYRYQRSEGAPGKFLVVDVEVGEVMTKEFELLEGGEEVIWTMREKRRPFEKKELTKLRSLIDQAAFWRLPSPNPELNMGFDGYSHLFEAYVRESYHLLMRYSPKRDGFARLCEFCEAMYESVVRPRRTWAQWLTSG